MALENLQPAPKVDLPPHIKPGIEFDGSEGTAQTPALESPDFDQYLADAGFDPGEIEVVGEPRISRWQRYDGEWLTAYRFRFRKKIANVNLPLLMREAKKKIKPKSLPKVESKALVVLWSDLQVGKVDYRGGHEALLERVATMQDRLMRHIKQHKPDRIIMADLGDTVENFQNANQSQQAYTNDLSLMEQVDVATTLAWETICKMYELVPNITYASVGSNHCQFRLNKQTVGKPTDDWGVFIGRQLARLAGEKKMNIRFLEPEPHDESLAIDVFGDKFHILGIVHGHQARRPDQMATWWRGMQFGSKAVKDATVLCHGHWHHLRVTELGSTHRGTSRYMIMAPTLDNGSGWWRLTTGEDSVPGLAIFYLEQGVDYSGTVFKL